MMIQSYINYTKMNGILNKMAFEITLDGKVFEDGEELLVLTAVEKKAMRSYIDVILMSRDLKNVVNKYRPTQ